MIFEHQRTKILLLKFHPELFCLLKIQIFFVLYRNNGYTWFFLVKDFIEFMGLMKYLFKIDA